jgi:hypothetical protein
MFNRGRAVAVALAVACGGTSQATKDPSLVSISGNISGAVQAGVTVTLTAAAQAAPVGSVTTGADGKFTFGRMPDGTYTLTAAAPSWSFVSNPQTFSTNHGDVGVQFISTPPSSPAAIRIAGDAASGVGQQTLASNNGSEPNPDVLVYESVNDVWTLNLRFDEDGFLGLGGGISFHGTPSTETFIESTPGLLNTFAGAPCWSVLPATPPGQTIVIPSWDARGFSLTLESVGPALPTNLPGQGSSTEVFYSAHGSIHADCAALQDSGAQGVVTFDARF